MKKKKTKVRSPFYGRCIVGFFIFFLHPDSHLVAGRATGKKKRAIVKFPAIYMRYKSFK
jgi:hypothetical protein